MPKTIQEVIDRLTEIVKECKQNRSALGYFAALYRKVTIRVRDGIARGEFEDNARMERLDILFAMRYINAYNRFKKGEAPTQSWNLTFLAAKRSNMLILQHLLLGINAHINLDLGIAAVHTLEGKKLTSLKNDFNAINALLAELVDDVQEKIGKVSPLFGLLDPLAGRLDERLVNFSINIARDGAWKFASEYDLCSPHDKPMSIKERDETIAILAENIARPKSSWLNSVIRFIGFFESSNTNKIIDLLAAD